MRVVGLLMVWKIQVDKTGHFSMHSEYSYIMGRSYVEWTGPLLNFSRGHFQTLEPSNKRKHFNGTRDNFSHRVDT